MTPAIPGTDSMAASLMESMVSPLMISFRYSINS